MHILLLCALVGCAYARAQQEDFDQQQIQQFAKTVKGGAGGWQPYNPSSADLVKVFEQRNLSDRGHMRVNLTGAAPDRDVGVCYIEVPTASLVHGGGHIPAGNGSQPHLSRIRGCCRGYIRNIHNFWKCDPICETECVNALCTAPNTCTCFPDHVKNLAGFCIATCPIGCQNGHCAGGECMCKEGFKLEAGGKFCIPHCKGNCGGIGNCTAPNTCECKAGFQSSPDGSCVPHCDQCANGDCIAPNECRCHQGYILNQQGVCESQCAPGFRLTPQGCKYYCERPCRDNEDCVGPNTCKCREGYSLDRGTNACVPQCNPGCLPTSRCVAPNVCDPPTPTHDRGDLPNQPYVSPDQSVLPLPGGVPQCAQPCLNGFCVGGNRCSCNPGYVPDNARPNMCVPHCPGGCPNGVCTSPNFCICNAGYYKDHSVKGRQACVKRTKRSVAPEAENKPLNVADLLIFEIPDDE
ncbi:hypothetical protein NE865_01340 [Phthorimaea operculella]|nr:hypothetical protein NE865_01340 [Phthorimaea operculella]